MTTKTYAVDRTEAIKETAEAIGFYLAVLPASIDTPLQRRSA
jgi:hypothetical protein